MNRSGVFLLVALVSLSGCGTYTPDIVEAWAQPGEEQRVVNAIVQRVRCEIREAVNIVLDADIQDARDTNSPRQLEWLENWGAQATLTLTMDEKTNINPGAVFNTPIIGAKTLFPGGLSVPATQSYSLGLGGKFGSTATRIDKISWFYPVSELRNQHPANYSCEPLIDPVAISSSIAILKSRSGLTMPSDRAGSRGLNFRRSAARIPTIKM